MSNVSEVSTSDGRVLDSQVCCWHQVQYYNIIWMYMLGSVLEVTNWIHELGLCKGHLRSTFHLQFVLFEVKSRQWTFWKGTLSRLQKRTL